MISYYLRYSRSDTLCLLWTLHKKQLGEFAVCLNELGLRSPTYDSLGFYNFEGDCRKNRVASNTKIKRWEI